MQAEAQLEKQTPLMTFLNKGRGKRKLIYLPNLLT